MASTEKLSQFFFVRKQQTLQRVNCKDLRYIHADGNYCFLISACKKKYAVKISLRQLLFRLPSSFTRIHKSYIVNLDYLEKLDLKERQAFIDGQVLPIGRTYLSELTQQLSIV